MAFIFLAWRRVALLLSLNLFYLPAVLSWYWIKIKMLRLYELSTSSCFVSSIFLTLSINFHCSHWLTQRFYTACCMRMCILLHFDVFDNMCQSWLIYRCSRLLLQIVCKIYMWFWSVWFYWSLYCVKKNKYTRYVCLMIMT